MGFVYVFGSKNENNINAIQVADLVFGVFETDHEPNTIDHRDVYDSLVVRLNREDNRAWADYFVFDDSFDLRSAGVNDHYELSLWLADRIEIDPSRQWYTLQHVWRHNEGQPWRFFFGELDGRQKTEEKIAAAKDQAVIKPFTLDGRVLRSTTFSDQLSTVIQAVNLHRDGSGGAWEPIDVLDEDRVITQLDTLAEAVAFVEQNVSHSKAVHAARIWTEANLEKMHREMQAATDRLSLFDFADHHGILEQQKISEAAHTAWKNYDIDEAFQERVQHYLESDFPLTADPEKALQQAKEAIESISAARNRWILGALDEQASHLAASCASQGDALQELSTIKQEAIRMLDLAEGDITEIRRLESEYTDRILSVEVSNSPDFFHDGVARQDRLEHEWVDQTATDAEYTLPLQLTVANPTSPDDLGAISLNVNFPDLNDTDPKILKVARNPGTGGDVSLKYFNDDAGGISNPPPYGRHRAVLTATNSCGPSDLIVDLLRPEPLISDPDFATIADAAPAWTWIENDTPGWIGGSPTTFEIKTPGTDDVIGTALQLIDNDDKQERIFSSPILPLKQGARYRLGARARQERGDRINYLFVEFFTDLAGTTPMDIDYFRADPDARERPAGWLGIGTFHYWGLMGGKFPADWTDYGHTFGFEADADIPDGAQSFRVGAILCWSGTTETEVYLTNFSCDQI